MPTVIEIYYKSTCVFSVKRTQHALVGSSWYRIPKDDLPADIDIANFLCQIHLNDAVSYYIYMGGTSVVKVSEEGNVQTFGVRLERYVVKYIQFKFTKKSVHVRIDVPTKRQRMITQSCTITPHKFLGYPDKQWWDKLMRDPVKARAYCDEWKAAFKQGNIIPTEVGPLWVEKYGKHREVVRMAEEAGLAYCPKHDDLHCGCRSLPTDLGEPLPVEMSACLVDVIRTHVVPMMPKPFVYVSKELSYIARRTICEKISAIPRPPKWNKDFREVGYDMADLVYDERELALEEFKRVSEKYDTPFYMEEVYGIDAVVHVSEDAWITEQVVGIVLALIDIGDHAKRLAPLAMRVIEVVPWKDRTLEYCGNLSKLPSRYICGSRKMLFISRGWEIEGIIPARKDNVSLSCLPVVSEHLTLEEKIRIVKEADIEYMPYGYIEPEILKVAVRRNPAIMSESRKRDIVVGGRPDMVISYIEHGIVTPLELLTAYTTIANTATISNSMLICLMKRVPETFPLHLNEEARKNLGKMLAMYSDAYDILRDRLPLGMLAMLTKYTEEEKSKRQRRE